MPSKKRKDGSFKDIAHPLNQSTRMKMEQTILDAYLEEIRRIGGQATQSAAEAESRDK